MAGSRPTEALFGDGTEGNSTVGSSRFLAGESE
jgi:hypothetical protein